MKNTLITFLIFSIGISGLCQIQKPLSQYGTTNQLAPGDLIGVSVSPFSAKERVKGITKANLIADLALNPTNGINSSQASNIVNQILLSSNLATLIKLIATTNGLQVEINNLQAATNNLTGLNARATALEAQTNNLGVRASNAEIATNLFTPRLGPPLNVIIETDLGYDCDDAVDLFFAHRMADLGYYNILAIVTPLTNWWSCAAIQAINTYNGRPNIPVGVIKTRSDVWIPVADNYASALATNFPHTLSGSTNFDDAVSICRRILASSADQSITWIEIAPPGVIFCLFDQGPDGYSPLHSIPLWNKKVKEFVGVLGDMPQPDGSWGFEYDVNKYVYYATNIYSMTNKITFIPGGWAVGYNTCGGYQTILPVDSPLKMALRLGFDFIGGGAATRPGWGQLCMFYSIFGLGTNFTAQTVGTNFFDLSTGSNVWRGAVSVNEQYLLPLAASSNTVISYINSNIFSLPKLGLANNPNVTASTNIGVVANSPPLSANSLAGTDVINGPRIYFGPTNSPTFPAIAGSIYTSAAGKVYIHTNSATAASWYTVTMGGP